MVSEKNGCLCDFSASSARHSHLVRRETAKNARTDRSEAWHVSGLCHDHAVQCGGHLDDSSSRVKRPKLLLVVSPKGQTITLTRPRILCWDSTRREHEQHLPKLINHLVCPWSSSACNCKVPTDPGFFGVVKSTSHHQQSGLSIACRQVLGS